MVRAAWGSMLSLFRSGLDNDVCDDAPRYVGSSRSGVRSVRVDCVDEPLATWVDGFIPLASLTRTRQ